MLKATFLWFLSKGTKHLMKRPSMWRCDMCKHQSSGDLGSCLPFSHFLITRKIKNCSLCPLVNISLLPPFSPLPPTSIRVHQHWMSTFSSFCYASWLNCSSFCYVSVGSLQLLSAQCNKVTFVDFHVYYFFFLLFRNEYPYNCVQTLFWPSKFTPWTTSFALRNPAPQRLASQVSSPRLTPPNHRIVHPLLVCSVLITHRTRIVVSNINS